MILTCPECATRYFIDADRLGPEGRQVRCSSCATSWRAESPPELPLELTPEPPPVVKPSASPVHRSFRAEVEARRRTRRAVAAGMVWAGLAAGFAMVVLGAVIFRVQVVNAWPSTAGAYAFLKMPVNPTGFAIEEVQGGPALTDGRMAIIATGALRNVRDDARAAPPVRVSLYDAAGRRVASQVVIPAEARVVAGDARTFKASFIDPPGAAQVQVEFAFDAKAQRRVVHHTAQQTLRGPIEAGGIEAAAVTAKPLPSTSPYALAAAPHG